VASARRKLISARRVAIGAAGDKRRGRHGAAQRNQQRRMEPRRHRGRIEVGGGQATKARAKARARPPRRCPTAKATAKAEATLAIIREPDATAADKKGTPAKFDIEGCCRHVEPQDLRSWSSTCTSRRCRLAASGWRTRRSSRGAVPPELEEPKGGEQERALGSSTPAFVEVCARSARRMATFIELGVLELAIVWRNNRHKPEAQWLAINIASTEGGEQLAELLDDDEELELGWFGLPCGTTS
jgi:hypothetical protein